MHDDEEERDEDTRSHEEGDPTTPRLAYNSYLPCRLEIVKSYLCLFLSS